MRIDRNRFYKGTCKNCKRLEHCQGGNMYSCARTRIFNSREFENYTGISLNRRYKEDGIKNND